ncbi:MAG: mannosyltransferase B [Candidatus Scalindua rubra]|uniref:Mannosyltransferase B n=1 Tax=Candidatus Scalindua rubra TaxID=1872076 RepID=A0A1E3XG36_9BACT|nr:MAG: mannosyltransferase B [Candidatus Scalindua rubra]
MQILCVTQDFPPNSGGIAVFLHNLCVQLSRLGHLVDVVTPTRKGCVEVDVSQPYRVYRYDCFRWLSCIVPFCRMMIMHKQRHYDVIFIGQFMTTHAMGALVLRRLLRVPYVILSHGNDMHYCISNWIDKPVAYMILHNASLILSNSHTTAKHIQQRGYQGPIQILHPGVKADEFRPNMDTLEVVKKYKLNGRRVVLSVSRLVARKGHDSVLRALPNVVKQIHNVLYLIVGQGKEETRLRRLVTELNLDKYVLFAGYVEQKILPALYCICDVFVMPSFALDGGHDYEGFGIVYIEANACGKPVIGGKSGGIEDAVIDGITGLLVNPDDVEKISKTITMLLKDKKYASELGKNGRNRVECELDWEIVGKKIEEILVNIVS